MSIIKEGIVYQLDILTASVIGIEDQSKKIVNIPESIPINQKNYIINSISVNAFKSSLIEEVFIPKTIKYISTSAFMNSKLNRITIADNSELETIGSYAFNDCLLDSIIIPKNVTKIDIYAFYNSKLKQIMIELDSNLQIIDQNAFENTLIESIVIPKNVNYIGADAFKNSKLKKVIFFGEKPKIGTNAFNTNNIIPILGTIDKANKSWNNIINIDNMYIEKWYYINITLRVVLLILLLVIIYFIFNIKKIII